MFGAMAVLLIKAPAMIVPALYEQLKKERFTALALQTIGEWPLVIVVQYDDERKLHQIVQRLRELPTLLEISMLHIHQHKAGPASINLLF
jgi:nitrate reductase NapAB chaperone NapD